jgi:hypothetical protein
MKEYPALLLLMKVSQTRMQTAELRGALRLVTKDWQAYGYVICF